ncbi:MAG TPA: polyprenyl synthetase family protein [Gemmatimonadales bacterium]|nr:polyprenyl synthetase family protein [Gemmatimonadales bacterium]
MSASTASDALAEFLTDARARVDAVLEEWSGRAVDWWPPALAPAMRYSLLGPGKRLRPALVVAAARAVGGDRDRSRAMAEIAAALEIVHAYSLVHDDLPCMDDDDLRRGRETTHRAFDVATATRAGFHMVPLAAAVLAAGMEGLALDRARQRLIAGELFRAAGAGGMIGGQAQDLAAEGNATEIARQHLEEIHRRKTGALIGAACVIGGLAGGASGDPLETLREYGYTIGLAFQIADDVLDATATSAELGKTAGKDATSEKCTFVALHGIDVARAEAVRLSAQAVDRLRVGGLASAILEALASYVVNRSR